MFILGVAGFTLASVLCGIAWSPTVLIAGRILQGLTATAMAPQVLASIRVLFPAAEQARALALYGATFGLANICGQVLGGVLVSTHPLGFAWQAIFLINLPIGLVALCRQSRSFSATRGPSMRRQLDLGGVVLLSLTLALAGLSARRRARSRLARMDRSPCWSPCPAALLAFVRLRSPPFRPRRRSAGRPVAVPQQRVRDRPGDGAGLLHAVVVLPDLRGLPAERASQITAGGGHRHAAVRHRLSSSARSSRPRSCSVSASAR